MATVTNSFVPSIRNNPWNQKIADYIFAFFFTLLGSLIHFSDLLAIDPRYVIYVFYLLFGSITLHIVFSKIFKVDRDTMIITSAAGIMSPPFVPSIARAIKNKDMIVPGIAVGILGYAMANVLGIMVVEFLKQYIK